jgi:hypothetical protein
MEARERGELVDRLMQRIGELEAKLYDKELAESQFTIPAIYGECCLCKLTFFGALCYYSVQHLHAVKGMPQ